MAVVPSEAHVHSRQRRRLFHLLLAIQKQMGHSTLWCGAWNAMRQYRSCLPKYCLACFQRNLDERLAAEPALTLSEPATPGTLQAEADLPMRDSEPECGWPRRKRESEQCWYARVQAHLDGPDKRKKQKTYMSTWRSSMTEADRRAWKDGIQKRVSAEGPVEEPAEEPGTEELDRGQVAESRQQEPVKVKETSRVLLQKPSFQEQ